MHVWTHVCILFLRNIRDDNDITITSLFSFQWITRIETFIDDQKWNHTVAVPSVCHVYSNDNQFEQRATRIQELRPVFPIFFLFSLSLSRFTPLFLIRRPGPVKYYEQNRPRGRTRIAFKWTWTRKQTRKPRTYQPDISWVSQYTKLFVYCRRAQYGKEILCNSIAKIFVFCLNR